MFPVSKVTICWMQLLCSTSANYLILLCPSEHGFYCCLFGFLLLSIRPFDRDGCKLILLHVHYKLPPELEVSLRSSVARMALLSAIACPRWRLPRLGGDEKSTDRPADLFHGINLHKDKTRIQEPPQSNMKVKGQRLPPHHLRLCLSLRMGNVTFPAHFNFLL